MLLVGWRAYAIHRGVSRELRVARLQSDFVSAVSHEFRSPLTTIRTISELLAHEPLAEEARRERSYVFLERETGRLIAWWKTCSTSDAWSPAASNTTLRLMMRLPWCGPPSPISQRRPPPRASKSKCASIPGSHRGSRRRGRPPGLAQPARKRRQVFARMPTVWVEGALNQRQVMISVRDRGIGIEPREQREIFQKLSAAWQPGKPG